jgi:TonB family protein
MGGFEQIKIQNGETTFTARNLGFTPVRVQELIDLIHLADGPIYEGKKTKQRTEDGVSMTCVRAENTRFKQDEREICLDTAAGDIVSETWNGQPDDKSRELFFEYFQFQGRRYPRRLALEENGSRVIKAAVTSLVAAPFDESLLNPPKGSIERRHCQGMKPPLVMKQVTLPPIGSNSDDRVSVTILADGSIGDIQLTARGGHKMDDATVAAIKKWKFKPAMCGTEPVVSDLDIAISVREN